MITGIDHIVIMTADLESAIRQWDGQGFTVVPGGRHPRGTHNALVCLQDGSYLELIAFWEPGYESHRWHRFQSSGVGLIDHALGSSDLVEEIAETGARGVPYDGPHPGARSRPDGIELEWRTAHAAGATGHDLPFLIDDVTDRDLRVPAGDAREHRNGVLGISSLQLVVSDIESSGVKYAALLGADPPVIEQTTALDQDSRTMSLMAGDHRIELHQPLGDGPAASRLQAHGNGPWAVQFFGTEGLSVPPDDVDGARISAVVR